MADPTLLLQHTAALTITVPQIVTGTSYTTLVSGTTGLLAPIDQVANSTANLVTTNPITYANSVVAEVSILFSYLSYMSNLIPGLTSLALLISAYLLVMLVKVILSTIKYIKQLVAQWL
jgi:hypothetical protein